MALRLSIDRVPSDPSLWNSTGLPWGCVVQPFANDSNSPLSADLLTKADVVARCEDCYAYINTYCEFHRYSWRCSVCDALNSFSDDQLSRYGNRARLEKCAELSGDLIELDVAAEEEVDYETVLKEDGEGFTSEWKDFWNRPVFVAVVDLSSSEEFLELVKSSLLAALEAINPGALFGLLTFSNKVGLYDVQGNIPIVKHVSLSLNEEENLTVELHDAMALQDFLAPVGLNKDKIAIALESLKPATSSSDKDKKVETEASDSAVALTVDSGSERCFGTAVESIMRYLGKDEETSFPSARLLCFLSGPPNVGSGRIDTERFLSYRNTNADVSEEQQSILTEQTLFYKQLAGAGVKIGLCVDLFVISDAYVDLASLKFLSLESGGSMYLYSEPELSTLPQDIYRLLMRNRAFGGVLRLRTSPQFGAVRAYGHFFPDAVYEGVYHILSCDSFDSYCFDFEFSSNKGFKYSKKPPMIQMAFQYTVLVPVRVKKDEVADADVVDSDVSKEGLESLSNGVGGVTMPLSRFVMRRRLRILNLQLKLAKSPLELYESANVEAILAILTHKVIAASVEEGIREGRLLLLDWIVILTANYNDYYKLAQYHQPTSITQLDVTFAKCSQLQPLPRLVFALLKSPLLTFKKGKESFHPDALVFLHSLYSCLDPSYLLRAIYPSLSSFSSPDKLAFPRHSLSRAALITSASPIFLMDAFTSIVVYYSPTAPPELPFPPPHNSLLRNTINKLKQDRSITPRLILIKGGQDDTSAFEKFLIEEEGVPDSDSDVGGFVSFLEDVANDVRVYMN